MNLSISVMAHVSRAQFFSELSEKLGKPPFSVDTPGPGNIGVWRNCKRAWEMHDPYADFHVVIQDDAIVCEHFKARAEKFMEEHLHQAYSFYFGTRKAFAEMAKEGMKQGFIVKQKPSWGLALCLATYLIPEMIEFCDKLDLPQDDERISRFLLSKNIPVCFPMPSLVDHRSELPSLVGDPGGIGRKAQFFIDRV